LPGKTGIDFINHITDTDSLNILDYLYYYNRGLQTGFMVDGEVRDIGIIKTIHEKK